MSGPEVDLCVTCYERTYRTVLAPDFFASAVAAQGRTFARRTAIVNNVADRADAERRAQALQAAGELDAVFFVEDRLEEALAVCGLTRDELGAAPYFLDWGLVAVSVPGPDWILHVDAEVRMAAAVDWVTPAIALMEADPRVLAANPIWYAPTPRHDTLARSTFEQAGEFALGLGFSDQVFLARRSELAAPIYRERCMAMRRYPMIHVSPSFEARVDAWMRHHDRLRANYRAAMYIHPDEIGDGYPRRSLRQRLGTALDRVLLAGMSATPEVVKPRCWRGV